MKHINGKPYFSEFKQKKAYLYLRNNINTEVLVVGGGITGAITSYYLCKAGYSVTLVDKSIIGKNSTIVSTALLDYNFDKGLAELSKMLGDKKAVELFNEGLSNIKEIEEISNIIGNVEFSKKESILYTLSSKDKEYLEKEYAVRKENGFDVYLSENHKIFNYKYALITKEGAAVINPYLFTTNLIDYCVKNYNMKVYENTEIIDSDKLEDIIVSRTNNNCIIKSKYLVYANGYDAYKYIKNNSLEVYKTFCIVTKKFNKDLINDYVALDTNTIYHYIRFTNDNRIMLGGEDIEYNKSINTDEKLVKKAASKYEKLEKYLSKLYRIKNVKVDYKFNGTFITTKDTLPIIDIIKDDIYCNLGYGSNGILFSVMGSKKIVDWIKNGYDKTNIFKIDR